MLATTLEKSFDCFRLTLMIPGCFYHCSICKLLDRIKANLMLKVSIFPSVVLLEGRAGPREQTEDKEILKLQLTSVFLCSVFFLFLFQDIGKLVFFSSDFLFWMFGTIYFFSSFRILENGSFLFLFICLSGYLRIVLPSS